MLRSNLRSAKSLGNLQLLKNAGALQTIRIPIFRYGVFVTMGQLAVQLMKEPQWKIKYEVKTTDLHVISGGSGNIEEDVSMEQGSDL